MHFVQELFWLESFRLVPDLVNIHVELLNQLLDLTDQLTRQGVVYQNIIVVECLNCLRGVLLLHPLLFHSPLDHIKKLAVSFQINH